jgi:hypothetical protein
MVSFHLLSFLAKFLAMHAPQIRSQFQARLTSHFASATLGFTKAMSIAIRVQPIQ